MGGTSLPGAAKDVIGVTCLTGVGVTGDVTKETGDCRLLIARAGAFTGVTGEVIRGWRGRETLGDCLTEPVEMEGETTVLMVCGLNSTGEDGRTSCFDWLVARGFFLAPFPF